MAPPSPVLDHIVIDVRDRIDEAAERFTALGFRLTPRGHPTLGSSNHLAMFATDYLELLGFGAGGAAVQTAPPAFAGSICSPRMAAVALIRPQASLGPDKAATSSCRTHTGWTGGTTSWIWPRNPSC